MSHCLSCPLCHEVVAHQCRNLEAQKHPSMSCGIICKIGKEASSHPNSINNRQLEEDSSQRDFITDHFIRCHQIVVLTEDENCMPLAKRKRKRCDRDVDGNSFYCHICRLTFLDPEPAKNRDKNNSNDAVVKEKELEDKHKYKLVPGRNGQKIVMPSFMKQRQLPTKKDQPELLIKTEVDTEIPEEVEKEDIDLGDDDFEDVLCEDMSEGDDVDLGDIDLGEMSEYEDVKDDDDEETKECKISQKELKNPITLINHMKNVHPIQSQSLKCEQCESVLKNPKSLDRHMRSVHRRRLKCRICYLTFETRSDMMAHASNDHVSIANEKKVLEDNDISENDLEDLEVGEMSHEEEKVGDVNVEDKDCDRPDNKEGDKTERVCNICQKEFSRRDALRRHLMHTHSAKGLKCEVCEKVLKNPNTLSTHMRIVHKKRVKCRQCELTFAKRSAMFRHMRQSHKKEVKERKVIDRSEEVTCNICEKVVRNAAKLHLHMLNFHPKERPECKQCDMTFKSRRALHRHNMVHKKEECELCHDVLKNGGTLRKHMWSVHGTKMPVVCRMCQEPHQDLSALRLHISQVHPGGGKRRKKCRHCDLLFTNRCDLVTHMGQTHPGEGIEDTTCKICGKFCKLKSQLMTHMRSSHSTQVHQCHLCNKVLKHQESYKHHIEYIHGDREVPCTLCPSVLKSKASLRMHMSYSHAAESIACELCGSMLKSIPAFRQHMRTHHSTVRLACELCGKVMKHGSSMNAHMKRVHAMETTRVTCGHCQLSFHNNSYLRAHLEMVRKQQEVNPKAADGSKCKEEQNCDHEGSTSDRSTNICKICGIPFPCPKTLEEHTINVHEVNPLQDKNHLCQFCGNGYKMENSLRTHIRKWHKQEEEQREDKVGLEQKGCGGGSEAVMGELGSMGGVKEDG